MSSRAIHDAHATRSHINAGSLTTLSEPSHNPGTDIYCVSISIEPGSASALRPTWRRKAAPEWSKAVKSAALKAASCRLAGAPEAVAGHPVPGPHPGSAELPRATRRTLRRRSRAGAVPRGLFDHAAAQARPRRPKPRLTSAFQHIRHTHSPVGMEHRSARGRRREQGPEAAFAAVRALCADVRSHRKV